MMPTDRAILQAQIDNLRENINKLENYGKSVYEAIRMLSEVYTSKNSGGVALYNGVLSKLDKYDFVSQAISQPPKQEKWIVHRTLRTNGMETYVGYSDDNVDDGCRKYFLGTFDGKNISGYLLKLKAHKFDYLEAIVLREQLNKQRAYRRYLWVMSKVEE